MRVNNRHKLINIDMDEIVVNSKNLTKHINIFNKKNSEV